MTEPIPTEHLRHPASYLPKCFTSPVQTSFPAPESFGEGLEEHDFHKCGCDECREKLIDYLGW